MAGIALNMAYLVLVKYQIGHIVAVISCKTPEQIAPGASVDIISGLIHLIFP